MLTEEHKRFYQQNGYVEEVMRRLDELSRPRLGFPYDFLASEGVRRLVHGDTFDSLDLSNRPNVP